MNVLRKAFSFRRHNSSRIYLRDFAREAGQSVPPGSMVLDAGAGRAPYREFFAHTTYETADFQSDFTELTYVCDLTDIPTESEKYDLIFLSQVLEHLPQPEKVLRELHRVLKPGGTLWLTAPLFFVEHQQPYDFYRYTQFGFRFLLEQAGFEVEKIEWLEGYFGTVSYQFFLMAQHLPARPAAYGGGAAGVMGAALALVLRPVAVVLARVFSGFDQRIKYVEGGLCKNYAVIGRKPRLPVNNKQE